MPGWSAITSERSSWRWSRPIRLIARESRLRRPFFATYWGQWAEAKARLERSSTRSIVTYLVDHPTDFRARFARLRREFRTLYFSAFQSHLWNLMLARWIERSTGP